MKKQKLKRKLPLRLIGEKTILTPLQKYHAPDGWRWINDKKVTKFLAATFPKTYRGEVRWILETIRDRNQKPFAILDKPTDKYIGNIALHGISKQHRAATLGIMIGEKAFWNKGYGTDAIKVLLKYAFEKLKLNKVSLTVSAENPSAQKCYEKCGFKKTGTMREEYFKADHFHDSHTMDILAREFKKKILTIPF